jgi:3-oxoacyl-[acyl-carrier-protein] synthase II
MTMTKLRRVVITGLGMVTPLGADAKTTWDRLIDSQSGAGRPEGFEVDDLACQIACQIPRGDGSNGTFNPDNGWCPKSSARSMTSSSTRWLHPTGARDDWASRKL